MSTTPRPGRNSRTADDPAGAGRVDPRTRARQVLVLALSAVVALVMLVLGIWQMSVYRTQGTRVLQERANRPAVSLDAQLASGTPVGELYGLQVTLHGSYLATKPVLVGTTAPYRVVMPFRDGQRIVGVARGTVPSLTASVPPAPTGVVDQTGIMLPSENKGNAAPDQSASTMPVVNLERLTQTWPAPVLPGFVTLSASESSAQHLGPQTVTMPDNASGRAQNLGYAMQWWVFAIFAIIAGIVLARTMGRRGQTLGATDVAPPDAGVDGDHPHG